MPTEPQQRQRQHLVSKGYQKNFAHDDQVVVLDARSGDTIDLGRHIKSNWRLDDFLTFRDATGNPNRSLEDKFAKIEGRMLERIRGIALPRISPGQKRALDALAAMHLVRSLSFVARHELVTDAFFENCIADFLADSRLLEIFVADRGRQPVPGELEMLVAAQVGEFQASPDLRVRGMRRVNAGIPEVLDRYRVQLVEAPDWMAGFVLADQPVLHARPDEGRYGFASQLAVGDADLIMVPIKRRLLAFYTVRPQATLNFMLKTETGLRVINAALCRNAVTEVACHPDDARDTSNVIRRMDKYPASALSDGTLK